MGDGQLPLRGLLGDSPSVGPYLVLQDILDRKGRTWLIEVTDDLNSGDYDGALLGRLGTEAASIVDMYLSQKYAAPFTITDLAASPQRLVKSWTVSILLYLLAGRRDRVDSDTRAEYDRTVQVLQALFEGATTISILPRNSNTLPSAAHVTDDEEPIFTRTRSDKSGNGIDRDETGTLDTW